MYNILIVEDHTLIRFGLKTAFESKEFIKEIYEASNAEDAIELCKKHKIDAVIMDLGLPNMNGIEATQEIKKINNKSRGKRILFKGYKSRKTGRYGFICY